MFSTTICYCYCSNFSDIFDVNWFISSLSSDVPIVKKLPLKPELSEERIYSTRVPRKCEAEYFKEKVLPLLQRKKVSPQFYI